MWYTKKNMKYRNLIVNWETDNHVDLYFSYKNSNFFYLFPWRKKKRISRKKIKESLRIYFLMTLSKLYSELCIYYESDKIYTDWWRFKRI